MKQELEDAFLRAALQRLDDGGWEIQPGSTNRILMEAVAEGIVAALQVFDETPSIVRKRSRER